MYRIRVSWAEVEHTSSKPAKYMTYTHDTWANKMEEGRVTIRPKRGQYTTIHKFEENWILCGGGPQRGPTLLFNRKPCFPPLTSGSDPGPCSAWDGFCARAASSRHITGFEVRPVQCLHTATSRACLRVGRPARLDLLVAAGWNQAPARPAREWSMQAVIGPSCASQPPDGIQWLVRTAGGSPKILGEGSGLGAPAPAG